MSLIRDYLALPQVQFFLNHWFAFLVLAAIVFLVVWYGDKLGRLP